MKEMVPKHIQICVPDTISDGSELTHLQQRIARHAKYRTDEEIDPSEAVAGVTITLAVRYESTAWLGSNHNALEEYFAENASGESLSRESVCTFKAAPATIITREL